MLHKIERVSIFDDYEYTTESSLMDTLTQSAGATFPYKNIKSMNANIEEPSFFGKKNKKKKSSDTTWKLVVANWLIDSGAKMLDPSVVKRLINLLLSRQNLGSEYVKDGDRVSNHYKYESNEIIYNNRPKQNYYFIYSPKKDKKLPLFVVVWKCICDYDAPIESFIIYTVPDRSQLPQLMNFLMQNERNGSAYK